MDTKRSGWGKKVRSGSESAPLILSNPSIDFLSFSVFRGPKNVENQGGERFELEAQNLLILGVIWESLGGILGAFLEAGGVIFLTCFWNVFWTTPGATPDGQSGAPGVSDTDRRSIDEDNFGGLGPRGGPFRS